jgi:long-chain acyl-CoA synthetase
MKFVRGFLQILIYDRPLVNRTILTYYAELGTVVQWAATFLHDQIGLRRADRQATILFNHDITVVLYFSAGVSGIKAVPINVEEPTDQKRVILEHLEASAICCWLG